MITKNYSSYILPLNGSNYLSVKFWLEKNGILVKILTNKNVINIKNSDILVIPGVLGFDEALSEIDRLKFRDVIINHYESKSRIIGICCGMQILFSGSDEGNRGGLNLLNGFFKKLPKGNDHVPNIGWRNCLESNERFYFMHSFALLDSALSNNVDFETIYSKCNVGFISGLVSKQLMLTQFHPEKSYQYGDEILKRFLLK